MQASQFQTSPALDYFAKVGAVECERHKAVLTIIACARRASWDSDCAGCDKGGKTRRAYGKHRCGCGRYTKKQGSKCALCSRDFRFSPKAKKPVSQGEAAPKKPNPRIAASCKAYDKSRSSKTPLRACARCGVVTQIQVRGLGANCYSAEKRAGTLDANYPAQKRGGDRRKKK